MRRIAIGVALAGVASVIVRALGPKLHERMMAKCEQMFAQMPDDIPPKRMLRGIEEIRADTARILTLLEARERKGDTSQSFGEAASDETVVDTA